MGRKGNGVMPFAGRLFAPLILNLLKDESPVTGRNRRRPKAWAMADSTFSLNFRMDAKIARNPHPQCLDLPDGFLITVMNHCRAEATDWGAW